MIHTESERRSSPGGGRVAACAAVALAVLSLSTPRRAAAQTCPEGSNVIHGTATVGDGSTPPANPFICPVPSTWPQQCYGAWGNVDLPMTFPGTYTFSAGAYGYLNPPNGGSATCTNDNNGCLVCSGNFSFTFFASGGSFEGNVYDATSGVPVPGTWVYRSQYVPPHPTQVDANGHYDMRLTVEPDHSNNWGVQVFGDGSGVGTGSYELMAGGYFPERDRTPATTFSSQNIWVDLYVKSPAWEPVCDPNDPCCKTRKPSGNQSGPSPQQPGSSVGEPVNVLTGNVWFDQPDTDVPGADGRLAFIRRYNSSNAYRGVTGAFGRGWTHSYEQSLSFPAAVVIKLRLSTGLVMFFQDRDGDSTFQAHAPITESSWIVKSGSTYTRYFKQGGSETYDSGGRLTSVVSTSGNATNVVWDGTGRLTSVTVPGGRSLTFDYDAAGKIGTVSGAAGVIASYEYDSAGQLQTVRYPEGTGYVFTYDGSGEVLTVADLSGTILETHTYSGGRGITSERSGGVEKLTFTYNVRQTVVTDALGNTTTYDYTPIRAIDYVTKITGPCSSCGGGGGAQTREWTYDNMGRIMSFKDGAGAITSYTYDAAGNLTVETSPAGTTTYTYDAQGRVLTRTAPATGTVTYVQGPSGPASITEQVTATVNRTTNIHYNSQGQPDTITDPRGKITTLGYNSSGDLTSVTDPLTHATSFGYDALGRRTTVTDALNHTTTTDYDARGRVSKITAHDGTHTDFAYDGGGRRQSVTDPLGRTTSYTYDAYGRLEAVLDPASGVTRYGYDVMSNLTSLTDAKGNTTSFEYDGFSRVKKVTYPGGAYESLTYDNAGRLATRVDRKNVTTTYSYDTLSRLTGKTYSDGTPAVSYTYDNAGRLLTAGNGTDSLTWTYDLAGQLLTEASSRNASTVAYTYDLAGNRLTVSLGGQLFVTYAYDDVSWLSSITRGSSVFGFGYDNANRRTSLSYPNGVNTSYSYDNLNRLTNLTATRSPATITQWGYTYDGAGNRTQKSSPDYTEDYGYDALSRLTDVNRTGAVGAKRWIYGYDPVGNRIREQIDNNVSTPAYNEKNQLTSSTVGGLLRFKGTLNEPGTVTVNGQAARMLSGNTFEATVSASAGTNTIPVVATDASGNSNTKNYQVTVVGTPMSYSYDSNGNLTSKTEGGVTWTYEWNAENQLTRVVKNSLEVASFKYDATGRRIEKVAGGVTTAFAWDEDEVLREQTSTGASFKYIHADLVDEPLARESTTGVLTSYHLDGLSSVVKTTDMSGAIVDGYRYTAWGDLEVGAEKSGYAFTGREWDPETGLHYFRARYLDPKQGRFIGEDPSGFFGGINFYSYVDGSPANYTDPFGLIKTKGFSPTQDQQMQAAAAIVERRVKDQPCCVQGGNADRIINLMNKATFIFKPGIRDKKKNRPLCGEVSNIIRWLQRRIHIGKAAFDDPEGCGGLECTILHEVTHLQLRNAGEGAAYGNEFRCLGCGTGKEPD